MVDTTAVRGVWSKVEAALSDKRVRYVEHVLAAVAVVVAVQGAAAVVCSSEWWRRGAVAAAASSGDAAATAKEQVAAALRQIEKEVVDDAGTDAVTTLPAVGSSLEQVLSRLSSMQARMDVGARDRGHRGRLYDPTSTLGSLQAAVFRTYISTNALFPTIFKGVRKYEAEVIAMTVSLVRRPGPGEGGDEACGLLTSGGSESILLSVKAYREWGRARGITAPVIVASNMAHPALDKACFWLGVRLVKTATDSNGRMQPSALSAAVTSNTVAIYASAPNHVFGTVDPIAEIAAMAQAKGVGLHVDNGLGGVVLSMCQREGLFQPLFDFRVPGVTSISIDLHQYGYVAKGACVVAFANRPLRRLCYTPVTDWVGGYYITNTMQGSRSGGIIAAAWGTLVHMGEDGYRRSARVCHAAQQQLVQAIPSVPGLQLLAVPDVCIVAVTSVKHDPYIIASRLAAAGWTLSLLQSPPGFRIHVTEQLAPVVPDLIKDMVAIVNDLTVAGDRGAPASGEAGWYAATSSLPPLDKRTMLTLYNDLLLSVNPSKAFA